MSNNLEMNLIDKYIVLTQNYKGIEIERVFLCKGGFGCSPFTSGSAIFGEFVFDGEECRIGGSEVSRLATDEEVTKAKEIRKTKGDYE